MLKGLFKTKKENYIMKNAIVLGLLRGDEGKGKIVDKESENYDLIIRFQGGPNAGHTIYRGDQKLVLHQIPSGILNNKTCIIGHGCIIDIAKLINEIYQLKNFDTFNIENLKIAKGCHIITSKHIEDDTNRENAGKGNGSTKCGISPCYRDKFYREGIRLIDWFKEINSDQNLKQKFVNTVSEKLSVRTEDIEMILKLIQNNLIDDTYELNYTYKEYSKLFEGAQGVFLDIDNPYYPNVSSSSVSVGGVITGTGINFKDLKTDLRVIGIVKAYMSSVGVGYFPTEIKDKLSLTYENKTYEITADKIREIGKEYGATTGRPRKVGLLDLPMVKYACDTIGITELCLTRLDTLMQIFPYNEYPYIPICVGYIKKDGDLLFTHTNNSWYDVVDEKCVPVYKWFKNWNNTLDNNFNVFIKYIEEYIGVKITTISLGKNKDDLMDR